MFDFCADELKQCADVLIIQQIDSIHSIKFGMDSHIKIDELSKHSTYSMVKSFKRIIILGEKIVTANFLPLSTPQKNIFYKIFDTLKHASSFNSKFEYYRSKIMKNVSAVRHHLLDLLSGGRKMMDMYKLNSRDRFNLSQNNIKQMIRWTDYLLADLNDYLHQLKFLSSILDNHKKIEEKTLEDGNVILKKKFELSACICSSVGILSIVNPLFSIVAGACLGWRWTKFNGDKNKLALHYGYMEEVDEIIEKLSVKIESHMTRLNHIKSLMKNHATLFTNSLSILKKISNLDNLSWNEIEQKIKIVKTNVESTEIDSLPFK